MDAALDCLACRNSRRARGGRNWLSAEGVVHGAVVAKGTIIHGLSTLCDTAERVIRLCVW
jgi:hypothetical protein